MSNYTYQFIASYLSDRYQMVTISNEKCSWMPLLKGIPQGSSFGPFLSTIFMNDLFYFIAICSLTNYADKNTLHMSSCTIETVLSVIRTYTEHATNVFVDTFMQGPNSNLSFYRNLPNLQKYMGHIFLAIMKWKY